MRFITSDLSSQHFYRNKNLNPQRAQQVLVSAPLLMFVYMDFMVSKGER